MRMYFIYSRKYDRILLSGRGKYRSGYKSESSANTNLKRYFSGKPTKFSNPGTMDDYKIVEVVLE